MRKLTSHHLGPVLIDLGIVPIAWLGAFFIRANLGYVPAEDVQAALAGLTLLVAVQGSANYLLGLTRTVWRYTSLPDLIKVLQAVLAGVFTSAGCLFLLSRLQGLPRSIFPLYAMLLTGGLAGGRCLVRWCHQRTPPGLAQTRVLVIGAGEAGESLVRDMQRGATEYVPVGFVDDNPQKLGRAIHRVPVLATCHEIPKVISQSAIDLILIALPSASAAQMRRVVERCRQTSVPFRTLPSLNDLADGNVSIDALREVSLQDLLGRDPVRLDWQNIGQSIKDQCVMVTGAGGSIGSELCRQIARLKPRRLVAVEQSEHHLYCLQQDLSKRYPELTVNAVLCDVGYQSGVEHCMATHRPSQVFHAAAYKHVPMLEHQACMALRNNVLGTLSVAQAAMAAGVETFVLISTDKAVNSTNMMGASKRLAELTCQHVAAQSNTRFITVRFGNVLGSNGSVIPLFREQIAAGGPVTVTHPDITRYFMSIPEAAQLILQSSVLGQGGEIFVLDMGKPIKITDLAEQMIALSGKLPYQDIAIEFVGLRPGEKLHEELFYQHEDMLPTPHQKIMIAKTAGRSDQNISEVLKMVQHITAAADERSAANLLKQFSHQAALATELGSALQPL